MSNTIIDKNTISEEMPDISKWAKVYYSETLTGEKTQVAFVEEIPQLEEAPDQITGTCLDLDYEFSQPGIKKATQIEMPIYFTHTLHKKLRGLKDKNLYWFFQNPAHTAGTGLEPLVRYLQGKMYITMDTVTVGEFLKDKMTIYKSSDLEESDGFPTASE